MHVPSPSFTVNDTVICEIAKVKYLGHVIANDMTDDADTMRQRRQLYALGSVLSRRFHMCSIDVKNILFRSFCTPMYIAILASYGGIFLDKACRAVIRNRIYGFTCSLCGH